MSFMWLFKHDRLLTNHNKSLKGIGPACYNLCGSSCETFLHALHDCSSARKVWVSGSHCVNNFRSGLFQEQYSIMVLEKLKRR